MGAALASFDRHVRGPGGPRIFNGLASRLDAGISFSYEFVPGAHVAFVGRPFPALGRGSLDTESHGRESVDLWRDGAAAADDGRRRAAQQRHSVAYRLSSRDDRVRGPFTDGLRVVGKGKLTHELAISQRLFEFHERGLSGRGF